MPYTFNIQYFDKPHQSKVVATIYLNLPQATLNEVKRNPFVLDLVNHPFVKNGITAMPNHASALVDNIHPCVQSVPRNAHSVACKYQESAALWGYKTFNYKIYVDAPMGYLCPHSWLDFTCGADYDVYECLYQSGRYVVAPQIPNTQVGIADGYYYRVNLMATMEMVRVTDASKPQQMEVDIIDATGAVSQLTQTTLHPYSLQPVRLNDELMTMIGFSFQRGNIYGLTDVDLFEGVLGCHGMATKQVYIKRDSVGYSLIVEDPNATAGCQLKKFFYLDEFQSLLWNEFKSKVTLTNKKLADICLYLNNVLIYGKIIAELPQEMDSYMAQNQGHLVTNEMKVKHVAQHFKVPEQVAHRFVLTRYWWE